MTQFFLFRRVDMKTEISLAIIKVKVTQSCPTLCNPTDYTVHSVLLGQNTGVTTFPSPGDIPNPRIEPRSPALQADSLPAEPQGKPRNTEWVAYLFSSISS